jgi:hypothetical protein
VHFHFLPTASSWLNPVEGFFRDLSQRKLKRLAVNSVAELIDAITRYIEGRNRAPRRFMWTASVDHILTKGRKGNRTLAAPHWGHPPLPPAGRSYMIRARELASTFWSCHSMRCP